jgi:DNA-binding transcriptional regulator YiaG
MNEFSDFIRFNRKTLAMSTEEFAKLIGCSKATISNYECGHKVPKDTEPFELRVRYVVKQELKKRREPVGV